MTPPGARPPGRDAERHGERQAGWDAEPGGDRPAGGHTARAGARRELAVAVVGHLAGAGLALLAVRQSWAVQVTARPAPLPPLRETYSGGELIPWLPGVALVGLAAGIALYATRGWARRLVAVAAALCGAAIVAGGGYGLAAAGDAGRSVLGGGWWPVLTVAGGLLLLAAAALTLVRGADWPSMGARYQRAQPPEARPSQQAATDDDPAQLWDALDTGSDPTDRQS